MSMGECMTKPLVGWGLGGPAVRPRPPGGGGRLGEPAWSPSQLLRDLELRLGLAKVDASAAQRVPIWSKRLASHVAGAGAAAGERTKPFYARSFEVDSLGTAKRLLEWRDALVEAGWNGRAVPGGGDRLQDLAAVEASTGNALPLGVADRLVRVENELRRSSRHRIYDSVTLVEDRSLWSTRWRSIFTLLEERKARLEVLTPALARAPEGTDLGTLQRMLRGELASRRSNEGPAVQGDGTLLVVRGDTSADLAELTAALLTKHRESATVVRCCDAASLETALPRHGLPPQGHVGSSEWRPAMQLLPLALELAYEPRDPYRALELLTLPVGPFYGVLGAFLARAVSKQPGVGGTEWGRQKEKASERIHAYRLRTRLEEGATEAQAQQDADAHVVDRMQRVAEWVEAPGFDASAAPRTALLAVATRVRTFLQNRLVVEALRDTYRAACSQAQDMTDALACDSREAISREEMRHLLDTVVRGGEGLDLSIERAGRIDHVDHPGALLAPASTVVFWGFVAGTERRPALPPWNRAEQSALAAIGVVFPDPGGLLAVESKAWRRGILAASERVVFVVPRTMKGSPTAAHPTWDEVAARLGLESEEAVARVTRSPHKLLSGRGEALVPVVRVLPLDLPEGRHAWTLPANRLASEEALQTSATALSALASCPLRFVLSHHARIRGGALAKVASGPLLNGSLGHRLVEELHREDAFALDETAFDARAEAVLKALLKTEGATLLLAGAAFERMQLVPQLVRAMRALRRYLVDTGWRIAGVEESVTTTSTIGILKGRLDVRLVNDEGKEAVLDLKWGESSYKSLLEEGRAVQLAAYVQGIHAKGGKHSLPPAAYFALQSGKVLTADARMGMGDSKTLEGATLAETWSRVERTAQAVQGALREGTVHVAATKGALPLLSALRIPEGDHANHYAVGKADEACQYCDYSAICGRAWEAVR